MSTDSPFLSRSWRLLTDARPEAANTFRIGHWNVLADQLAESGGFQPEPPMLAWPERSVRLLAIIDEAGPFDVLSLVECDHFADFWEPAMRARGLVGWHARKLEHRWNHGVALFYRVHKFAVRQLRICQDGVAAISAQLQICGNANWHFSITTTHFKAKEAGAAQRISQAVKLITDVIIPDDRVMVVGDFNATPGEQCMCNLARAYDLDHVCYDTTPEDALPWTTWKQRDGTTVRRPIDHILQRNMCGTRILAVPYDIEVMAAGFLPGTRYASDHLLLAVDCSMD